MNNLTQNCRVRAQYAFSVLENGEAVEQRPFAENAILDAFLNRVCDCSGVDNLAYFFWYHALGSGTTPVAYTDTGLVTEVRRTGTRLTGAGNLGSAWVANTYTLRLTFDHSVEIAPQNYAEHGLSPSASPGANLMTRALISGGTLSVGVGQQVRCVYDISVTVSPGVATAASVGGTGWPVSPATTTDGDMVLAGRDYLLGSLSTTGSYGGYGFLLGSEYTYNHHKATALSAITLPSFGGYATRTEIRDSEIDYTKDAYVSGTYQAVFRPAAAATAASWASTGVVGWNFHVGDAELVFKYDEAQTKANTHTLLYPSITVTWSR